MSKKILVIGSGFLGTNIIREFQEYTVVYTSHTSSQKDSLNLDITDPKKVVDCFKNIQPDVVINCAANTNIDYLERNSSIAFNINGEGVKNISIASEKHNARLIHISSDGIFDGIHGNYTEESIPNPTNIYAKSKVLGEKYVSKNCSNYVIIRTNFYGNHSEGKFLFNNILSKLRKHEHIIGFDDVIFNPLEICNLSRLISEVALSNYVGILNLSSDEPISKYQFCYQLAKTFDFDTSLIHKGSVDDVKFIGKRPKNTSLDNSRSKQIINSKITSLTDWLTKIKDSEFF